MNIGRLARSYCSSLGKAVVAREMEVHGLKICVEMQTEGCKEKNTATYGGVADTVDELIRHLHHPCCITFFCYWGQNFSEHLAAVIG